MHAAARGSLPGCYPRRDRADHRLRRAATLRSPPDADRICSMPRDSRTPDLRRRLLLRRGAVAGAGLALAPLFAGLTAANARARVSGPLGQIALRPVSDAATGLELLKLPEGFRCTSLGWTGDLMNDGAPTPDRHDGMAVVDVDPGSGTITLMRNHERGPIPAGRPAPRVGGPDTPAYDGLAIEGAIDGYGGGTTAIQVRDGRLVDARGTLAGTIVNCAGGATPWGSWLTCEEGVIADPGEAFEARFGRPAMPHGYVFEVPTPRLGAASARPIVAMGRMQHEAVAVDPRDSTVYVTEDNGPHSGFYRFLPDDRSGRIGSLEAGGSLEMLKVRGVDRADLREPAQGEQFDVEWVPVADPDRDPEALQEAAPGIPLLRGAGRSGPYLQGEALGAARFARGEGCFEHAGVVYMVDTSGGAAGKGVVWAYLPATARLTALFVSPGEETANHPDNITVSPRGGILACEDGGSFTDSAGEFVGARLLAISPRGEARVFAENNMRFDARPRGRPSIEPGDYRGGEFAGACFSPDGGTLFVNLQTPGITLAVTGPFERLGL
jgi:secreted PhoX family phosphatase